MFYQTVKYTPIKTGSIFGGNTFRSINNVSGDKGLWVPGSLGTVLLHRLILPPHTLLRAVTVTNQSEVLGGPSYVHSDGMEEGKHFKLYVIWQYIAVI